jgi:hypothetical protein
VYLFEAHLLEVHLEEHLLEEHFVVESGEVGALIIRYKMTPNAMKNKTISHQGSSQNNILYIKQTSINNLVSML